GELRLEAAVVHRSSDVEDDAPQELGVDLGRGDHLLALRQATRDVDELSPFGRAERRRRSDRHARASELVVEQQVVPARDLGKQDEAIAFGEEADQVRDRRRYAERRCDALCRPDARRGVDHRAQHEQAETGLLERRDDPFELLAPRGEVAVLARQLEERPRVSLRQPAGHAVVPAEDTNSRTNRSWSPGRIAPRSRLVARSTASSMSSARSAARAIANSYSPRRRASFRMRSAASRPTSTSRSRSISAAARRSARSWSRTVGRFSMSRASLARSSAASRRASAPAWSASRSRAVRARKYSMTGPRRK